MQKGRLSPSLWFLTQALQLPWRGQAVLGQAHFFSLAQDIQKHPF